MKIVRIRVDNRETVYDVLLNSFLEKGVVDIIIDYTND